MKLTKLQQIMKQDIERAIRWWLPDNYRLVDRKQRKDAGKRKTSFQDYKIEKEGGENGTGTVA